MNNAGLIQQAAQKQDEAPAKQSLNVMISTMLDKENMRKRFDELLGKRTPQFISSLVSLINSTEELQKAIYQSPMTVIQSALKAATYDLPIDPNLGFAYIVPFKKKLPDGSKKAEAQFIMGYKGMLQLALRTGAYKTLNIIELRQGELKHYNRLTEEIEIDFIEDDEKRESTEITGYVGYFKLINGTEKTIYMSIDQIKAHERKHRKGQYMGKGWREDFEAMCSKTVMRRLIGKWGLMSIDYQQADARTLSAVEAITNGTFDDEDSLPIVTGFEVLPGDDSLPQIDAEIGEVFGAAENPGE